MSSRDHSKISPLAAVMAVAALRINFRTVHEWQWHPSMADRIQNIREILGYVKHDITADSLHGICKMSHHSMSALQLDLCACHAIANLNFDLQPSDNITLVDSKSFFECADLYATFISYDANSDAVYLLPSSLAEMRLLQSMISRAHDLKVGCTIGEPPVAIGELLNRIAEQAIDQLQQTIDLQEIYDSKTAADLVPAISVLYVAHELACHVVLSAAEQIFVTDTPRFERLFAAVNLRFKYDPEASISALCQIIDQDIVDVSKYPWVGFVRKWNDFFRQNASSPAPILDILRNIQGYSDDAVDRMRCQSIGKFIARACQNAGNQQPNPVFPDGMLPQNKLKEIEYQPVDFGYRELARMQVVQLQNAEDLAMVLVSRLIGLERE